MDAFLLLRAKRYDVKVRKYMKTPLKYNYSDVGLRNARLGFRQKEETHIMENVLFIDLLRRGFDVDVGVASMAFIPPPLSLSSGVGREIAPKRQHR